MTIKKTLKLIHLLSTGWFVLCVLFMVILSLREAGVKWWIIFSISGHSAVVVFLLISLYLFAIFRGVAREKKTIESPLTATNYYIAFYDVCPFLGAFAGSLAIIGTLDIIRWPVSIAMGTFWATFIGWIVVDPAVWAIEMLLPASRASRKQRMEQLQIEQQKLRQWQADLLATIREKEKSDKQHWGEVLRPTAEELARMAANEPNIADRKCERKAVDLGVTAWQTGGIRCMQYLYEMVNELCRRNSSPQTAEYISGWWDGIGTWRHMPLKERAG